MQAKYSDVAQFFIIYIKEAHPSDDWAMPVDKIGTFVKDPTSASERQDVAHSCVADLEISIPTLLDDMENTAARAYKGWPDRLYLVGKDGNIAFHGGPGPQGFRPEQLEAAIREELERNGTLHTVKD